MAHTAGLKQIDEKNSYIFPMIIIGSLFFIFGFITWLNSVLIPFLKQACELSDFQATFVTLAFYASYFFMAIPSSAILKKTGYAKGMSIGLGVMALGSLIFIPAAMVRSYPVFLLGFFVQTTGMTLLQTASNPYVTILGPIESAAKRISIMGICNKIAGMIGIFILVKVLFSDTKELSQHIGSLTGEARAAELDVLASRLIMPYVVMAGVLIVLALLILKAHLPEVGDEEVDTTGKSKGSSIFNHPNLILGVLCIFVYVGVEVIAIDFIGLYGQFQGFDLAKASQLGIYSLIALTIGYLLGIVLIPKIITQRTALAVSAAMGLVFAIGALLTSGEISIALIVLLSFAHAFMWPCIWPLALDSVGSYTKLGSALLIMGVVGGGLIPLAYGAVADNFDRQMAYLVTLPCYVYILYFAIAGSRIKKA
jgi:MFS transporter, FHS family, L-fucose permease